MFTLSLLSTLTLLQQGLAPLPLSEDPTLRRASNGAYVAAAPLAPGFQALGTAAVASLDDFHRPDGDLGPGWKYQGYDYALMGNACVPLYAGNAWIQRAFFDIAAEDAVILIDLEDNPPALQYAAAVHGAGGTDMAFTKVQSNAGGMYDRIGFYHGVGAGTFPGFGGFFPIAPVRGGIMKVYIDNHGDRMNIDIDEDRDGVMDFHFESSGLVSTGFSSHFGTKVGLGSYGAIRIGGWAVNPDAMPKLHLAAHGNTYAAHLVDITPNANFTFLMSSAGQSAHPHSFGLILVDPRWQTQPRPGPSASRWDFHAVVPAGMQGQTIYCQAIEESGGATRLTNLTSVSFS